MARTSIPVVAIGNQGAVDPIVWTTGDATNDHEFLNDGKTIVIVRNGGGVGITVSVISVADEAGRTGDLAIAVAAGDYCIFGPLKQAWWNQSGGVVHVDLDTDASVVLTAFSQRFH